MGSECLVSVVRGKAHLEAVISREERDGDELRCVLETRGLTAVPAAVCPQRPRLETAWAALAGLRRLDEDALMHAAVLLLETVGARGGRDLAPRLPSAGPLLLALLAEGAEATAGRLVRLGYDRTRVRAALRAADPALAFHHDQAAGAGRLPPVFLSQVLPLLRGLPWRAVRKALAAFWDSGLDRDERLRAAIVRLLVVAGGDRGLQWWHLALRLAPPHQLVLVTALIHTRACVTDPAHIEVDDIDALGLLAERDSDGVCLWSFASGIRSGLPLPFLMPSLRIAQAYAPTSRFTGDDSLRPALRRLPPDAEDVVSVLLAHVTEPMGEEWGRHFAIGLWRCCGTLPGLVDVLRRPVFLSVSPQTSFALLRFLVAPFYYEERLDLPQWRRVLAELTRVERDLGSVPASHQAKFVELMESALLTWSDPQESSSRLPIARVAARRLSQPPFSREVCTSGCLGPLVEAAVQHPERFSNAPDESFKRLEGACGRGSRRDLLARGLKGLAARCPALVVEAFVRHPEALFSAATLLGSLSAPRCDDLLRRFRAHPVFGRRFVERPLSEQCALLEAWRRPGQTSAVPRKLRLHLETGNPLSPASLEGHRQTVTRRLLLVKLDLIRQAALQALGAGLPSHLQENERGRHALMMLASIGINRRLLRRLLADPGATGDCFENHPASQRWYARHSRLDPRSWRVGVTHEQEISGLGRVRIAIEGDPLDALKLGTYVGSCLSVGGAWSHSAVAVVADVNKRVVYARRSDGSIVGRQVLAVTEDDRLACFGVYPVSAGGALKQAFGEFDRAFACFLGLEIFVGDDYEIALILAQDWFDDGLWDLVQQA